MGCTLSTKHLSDTPRTVFSVVNLDKQGQECTQGRIEISDTHLILYQREKDPVPWPLRSIRRFGFEAELFTFESGRKGPTGEGFYVFKCGQAEDLNNLLNNAIMRSVQEERPAVRQVRSNSDLISPLPPAVDDATAGTAELEEEHLYLKPTWNFTDSFDDERNKSETNPLSNSSEMQCHPEYMNSKYLNSEQGDCFEIYMNMNCPSSEDHGSNEVVESANLLVTGCYSANMRKSDKVHPHDLPANNDKMYNGTDVQWTASPLLKACKHQYVNWKIESPEDTLGTFNLSNTREQDTGQECFSQNETVQQLDQSSGASISDALPHDRDEHVGTHPISLPESSTEKKPLKRCSSSPTTCLSPSVRKASLYERRRHYTTMTPGSNQMSRLRLNIPVCRPVNYAELCLPSNFDPTLESPSARTPTTPSYPSATDSAENSPVFALYPAGYTAIDFARTKALQLTKISNGSVVSEDCHRRTRHGSSAEESF